MIGVEGLERVISGGTADSSKATLVLAGAILELSKAIRDTAAAALLPCNEDDVDLPCGTPCGQREANADEFVEPSARGTLPIEPVGAATNVPANVGRGCGCQNPPLPTSLGGPR